MDRSTKDQISGNWMQFKGKLREKWGDLTDDDLDRVQGQRDRLLGVIQEKVGEERTVIERDVDRLARDTNYRF